MLQLAIIALAVLGMIWNTDPLLRPYVDVAIWALCAGILFTMGVRFDNVLRRWEAKPHWRRVHRSRGRQCHHSGTSIPLLDK
jgi:hypothetical protein